MAMDRIYDSAEGFARALDRAVDRFEDEADTVVRKTVIDVTEKIKKDTPRDTGRAAAGWILTSDQPSDYEPPEGNYDLTPPQDSGDAASYMWWIVNNLEYIEPLEDGHSDQAPNGMVANALNAFGRLLSDQLDDMETIE
jgi:hypothetical protein